MAEGDAFDAILVGSGVNSLACAALLARAGWRVCVLERNDWFGGAIKTEELTEPGFLHDVFSAWHPLWVGGVAHAELGGELAARGLEYVNTDLPTATAFPDGGAAFLLRTPDGNAQELGPEWPGVLERFLPNADLAFGVLGTELWSGAGLALAAKAVRRLGRAGAVAFLGEVLQSSRDWLETTFAAERAHGVLAPWVLHTGLGPDQATSGFMTQVIAVAVQEGGMPVPRGGGARLADALVQLIRDHGGVCETDRDVERVLVRSGRAVGVRLTDGETIEAERAVVASVTPTQLHERLLADVDVPAPTCQSRSTGVAWPGLLPNGRQRKFWSSASAPPYGSPCRRLTFARWRSCGPSANRFRSDDSRFGMCRARRAWIRSAYRSRSSSVHSPLPPFRPTTSSSPAASPLIRQGSSWSWIQRRPRPSGARDGSSVSGWPTTTVASAGSSPRSASFTARDTPSSPGVRWTIAVPASRSSPSHRGGSESA